MKKVLAFVLAALMLLSLASCGSGKASSGSVIGDVYKNDSIGIKFTKPDGWEFLPDDELAVEMNTGGNSFKKQLENGVAYDAVAKDAASGNMVIISFVNLEKKYSKDLTVEEYAQEMKKQLKQVSPTSTVALSDVELVEFDGEEFSRVVTGVTQNKATTRRVTFLKNLGGVMFSAQVVLMDDTSISDVEAMFK